ncbi:MAG: NAD(+)/NADH kinase [Clostridia bacterium]|nr:NAD(+)/NADH kinase [Clostridia bacterium]
MMSNYLHSPIKKVMIWPNTGKEGMAFAVRQTADVIRGFGAEVILAERALEIGIKPEGFLVYPQQKAMVEADFIIVLGGDGTILAMAQYAAPYHVPLLGVNLGHVGFMSELEFPELRLVERIFTGDYSIDERMMLDVAVVRGGEIVSRSMSLNEAIIKTGSIFHISKLEILCDNEPVCILHGDGAIIATPTGSTAYSLSAGGPVIEPSVENISMVPICPRGGQAKPYIFAPHREICVVPRFFNDAPIFVSCDGRKGVQLEDGDRIYICRAPFRTSLLRVKDSSFYSILNEKLTVGHS